MAVDGPQLTPVGEKSLQAKCKAQAVAYCPTMDLIALATEDEELRVFRLNGQRVFGGSFGGDPYLGEDEEDGEIRGMAWKGDGEFEFLCCWFLRYLFFLYDQIFLALFVDSTLDYLLMLHQVASSLSRVEMARSAS